MMDAEKCFKLTHLFKNTNATATQNPVSMHSCSDNIYSPLPNEEEGERVWTDEKAESSGEQVQEEEADVEDERKVHWPSPLHKWHMSAAFQL